MKSLVWDKIDGGICGKSFSDYQPVNSSRNPDTVEKQLYG